MRHLRALTRHFEAREARRDGALPAGLFDPPAARRTLRRADRARNVALVGALLLVAALGLGVDAAPGIALATVGSVVLVTGGVVWTHGALTLARAEQALRRDITPRRGPDAPPSEGGGPDRS